MCEVGDFREEKEKKNVKWNENHMKNIFPIDSSAGTGEERGNECVAGGVKQAPALVVVFLLCSPRERREDKQNFAVDVCGQLLLTYEKYIQRTGWLADELFGWAENEVNVSNDGPWKERVKTWREGDFHDTLSGLMGTEKKEIETVYVPFIVC